MAIKLQSEARLPLGFIGLVKSSKRVWRSNQRLIDLITNQRLIDWYNGIEKSGISGKWSYGKRIGHDPRFPP